MIGTRNMKKALLRCLDPTKLRDAEKAGDYTTRLALMEEQKSMPWSAVWDFYCEQNNRRCRHRLAGHRQANTRAKRSQNGHKK